MNLLFSEYKSDYSNYIFPYAIWAIPEQDESVADIFAQGFLPSSRNLDRFYLCRQIRIHLPKFVPSSENRRILRKGKGIVHELVNREDFTWTNEWRNFCKKYADQKFGHNVMNTDRLDRLMNSPITSHVLVFSDTVRAKEVGLATLYLEQPTLAYYYYAFYDLNYFKRNLGMYMMTSAVVDMQHRGFEFLYLGTCYSQNALYKTQFTGAEFFNGFRWSKNLAELKYLLRRDAGNVDKHLLENEDFLKLFYDNDLSQVASSSLFKVG